MSVRNAEVVSSFSSPSSDCKVPPQKKRKTEQKKERFLEPSGPEPLVCSEVSPGHLGNQREHLLLLLREEEVLLLLTLPDSLIRLQLRRFNMHYYTQSSPHITSR